MILSKRFPWLQLLAVSKTCAERTLLLPKDIFMDSTARVALQSLRQKPTETAFFADALLTERQKDYATLTLVGSKGGGLHEQINQDRSFVLLVDTHVVSGVLDGHGASGHFVAEYARHVLLEQFTQVPAAVKDWLTDSFLQADAAIPDGIAYQGGATCSIVVQYQNHLYFANAGDSQSFVAAAVVVDGKVVRTKVLYETRLDTPSDPEERARLTAAGATVNQEKDDDLRVWHQEEGGEWNGVAMSRVLGDRGFKAVIADPVIQVLNVKDLKQQMVKDHQECDVPTDGASACGEAITAEQVHLFVVSATDGVMDSMDPSHIAEHLAPTLYAANQNHPLLAVEDLLHESAAVWHEEMEGTYRDDMAMAIAKVL